MIPHPPGGSDDTPLPGAVMPLGEEAKLIRKPVRPGNDNQSMRKERPGSRAHYSDDDDHDQTVPI